MKYAHFHQNVSENGEKYAIRYIKETKMIEKENVYPKASIPNNNMISQYFRTFVYYAKARSNVYIFAFATMISLILGTHANLDPIIAAKAVTASYFLALGAYVYNDITDFEVDKINKTNRPSVTGKATKSQLVNLVSFLFGFSVLLTASINFYSIFISVFFTLLGITYSHQRFNLKNKFPLKTVATASGAALLSLLGGTAVTNISLPIIYAALFFFAFFFILGPLGDIGDLKGDRAGGRRTFPIVIGMKPTLMVMLSVPILILLITLLTHIIVHFNNKMFGIYPIVGTSMATLALLLYISKRLNDVSVIKSMRPKMRYLHVLMQISLLLAFL